VAAQRVASQEGLASMELVGQCMLFNEDDANVVCCYQMLMLPLCMNF
jgi:hypothetical protein